LIKKDFEKFQQYFLSIFGYQTPASGSGSVYGSRFNESGSTALEITEPGARVVRQPLLFAPA
jgi:hypothetical protein